MDLEDPVSVNAFAGAFVASGSRLDILINNAGVLETSKRLVANEIEAHFWVNHLAHMLLTCRLCSALTIGGSARVVTLSSLGHRRSPVVFDDVNFEHDGASTRPYSARVGRNGVD
jgi:NAD(P)-dependent dehydrogenase (short-subunit alcohol dehydrogenase family)